MNSAEPRGKEETGEGRAVGAGRGRAPARPSRGRPGPPRGSAPRFGRSGRGRVTFRSGVRRLAGRFRRRRWEELGLPEEAAPRPPPSAPARAPAPTPGPRLRPNRYLRVLPPPRPRPGALSSWSRCFQLPHQREETQGSERIAITPSKV